MSPPRPDPDRISRRASRYAVGGPRATYLDRVCGDDATLRSAVEALLRAEHDAGRPLLTATAASDTVAADPTSPAPALLPAIVEVPGTRIGPYRLVRSIGEGGMGVVFLAQQDRPIRRQVALKVIKPGMDSAVVLARFEAERQALALMDHPNIARVLDVGATPTGRPYFVMELVPGVPITEYCDQHRLTPRDRLELFLPVCRAIQHAHQKGIIHRDIKPSNVLVADRDGGPEPRVIDFGVAKATEQRLTERTMFTEFGAIIGTLEYMSPEQAEMGALDVDTRSDIYSLGAVLYELLTGSTPLQKAKLRWSAFSDLLRRVREEEPSRPSTRLGDSKAELASISAQRRTEPARLSKLIRGELDWIVMKALEKDRARRYESASALARDIRRHLDGDTVEASPPSARYRLGKFARRHRAALATAAAFAFLLVAATAVSATLAVRAEHERDDAQLARDEATAARDEATKAQRVASEQRDRAVAAEAAAKARQAQTQAREAMAIEAIQRFGAVVDENPELRNYPALASLRRTLLKEPQAFFEKLRDQLRADGETTPDSLARLAIVSLGLARLNNTIGNKDDALRAFQEAFRTLEGQGGTGPSGANSLASLAAILREIGDIQDQTGRPAEAMESYLRARSTYESLVGRHPTPALQAGLARSWQDLGRLQRQAGDPAEAARSYAQAQRIWDRLVDEHPDDVDFLRGLARSRGEIARLQMRSTPPAEVLAALEQARGILDKLARQHRDDTRILADLATICGEVADFTPDPAQERAERERARAIWDALVEQNSTNTAFLMGQAASLRAIGALEGRRGHPNEALASFEAAREIRARLSRDNPSSTTFRAALAEDQRAIGVFLLRTGRPTEALPPLQEAQKIQERLAQDDGSNVDFQVALATIDEDLGRVFAASNRLADALAAWERARDIREELGHLSPTDAAGRATLAAAHAEVGALRARLDRPAEALAAFEPAREIRRQFVRDDPADLAAAARLAQTCTAMGNLLFPTMKKPAEALALHEEASDIRQHLAWHEPTVAAHRDALGRDLASIGVIQWSRGEAGEAVTALRAAVLLRDELIREDAANPEHRRLLARALDDLGVALRRADRADEAPAVHARAGQLWEDLDASNPSDSDVQVRFANNRVHLAGLVGRAGDLERAKTLIEQARGLRARAQRNDPAEIARQERLTAVLAGDPPRSNAERLELATRAYDRQQYRAATRLFAEALANEPKLIEDRRNRHAYNAACAAIPAAAGLGRDEPPPDAAERDRLRAQGLAWLKAELATWNEIFDINPARERNAILLIMKHWKDDPDLNPIRAEADLARLPEAERPEYRKFWAEVDQLLDRGLARP